MSDESGEAPGFALLCVGVALCCGEFVAFPPSLLACTMVIGRPGEPDSVTCKFVIPLYECVDGSVSGKFLP